MTMTPKKKVIEPQFTQGSDRQAILQAIQSYLEQITPPTVSYLREFAWHYYKNAPIEALQSCSTEILCEIFLSHWRLSDFRKPGTPKLRVFNPEAKEVWARHYSVIMLATDDMPFIVDSLCLEITRRGIANHFMIHLGNLQLIRTQEEGQIIAVSSSGIPAAPITQAVTNTFEALFYMVIDRQSSQEALTTLHNALQAVLTEVRAAVTDWPHMRAKMEACLVELTQNPPPYDIEDVEESKAFLSWLLENFIFLGCRSYLYHPPYSFQKDANSSEIQRTLRMEHTSSLGVLRDESRGASEKSLVTLPPEARQLALSPQVLVFSTTSTKARVHRPVYTEYISVKRFDEQGNPLGEYRFIGLYTSTVYQCDARTIPLVRRKLEWVLTQSQLPRKSHAGKALLDILLNLPRTELLQASASVLLELALGMRNLQEKPAIRLFLRQDSYQRFISCLVYIPREQLTTALQHKIEAILMHAFSGLEFSFETVLGESRLARIHFLIRTQPKKIPSYEVKQIEKQLVAAARSWQDDLKDALFNQYGLSSGILLLQRYHDAFPGGYRETWPASEAASDIAYIEKLSPDCPLGMNLYPAEDKTLRFRLFQLEKPIVLSTALAVLEKMGLQVINEWPTEIRPATGSRIWIHDFGLRPFTTCDFSFEKVKPLFQEAFHRIWKGEAENDSFNYLILTAGLSWQEVVVLRAYTKYMRQMGIPFSQAYVEAAVIRNAGFVTLLIELFRVRFNPMLQPVNESQVLQLEKKIEATLDRVTSLDEDRMLRQLWTCLQATLRTNYFQNRASEQQPSHPKHWLSFKLDSSQLLSLPKPRPLYEIFVYSPQMEGIHLRAGKVARGGLRWSDRLEDFRTEILGLMKAQQVKNAVIVPAGAKGGFICKTLSSQGDRDLIQQQVIYCYQSFIRGLLDITDNLQDGLAKPPSHTVCYDEHDPYLVVAADKGTASFSDIANQESLSYGFWLGDAFASGGSQGYDHKKMGITARGAWESVKCHFHALGIDPERDDFSVLGIGDMAGDVFGNGMLLSQHIKLVAAFNHLHIFIDPTPNPQLSFAERKRLFETPRSSWADYNPKLISAGGSIFSRSQKSITLTPEIQKLLDLSVNNITPDTLIRALLTLPVDLLWNGGIGTYVKASSEQHLDVGDKSNDALRVDADQLRCRVVGEGGNLGFTQLGRVEYALKGGFIYTDFIDNSAGVDCSDHEVNCKILLNSVVAENKLSIPHRNQLLADMTNEVAQLVLSDNYQQTRAITLATANSYQDIELYRSYLNSLERDGLLDRTLEYLPDNQTITERKALGIGLTSPEIAILLAYTKMYVKSELLQLPDMPNDACFMEALASAFPKTLKERYIDYMKEHSLRSEIIATKVSNKIVNEMGIIFVYRLKLETGADIATIIRAYIVVGQVFGLEALGKAIANLETQLPFPTSAGIAYQINRLVRRTVRWFIEHYKAQLHDITSIVSRFSYTVIRLQPLLPKWLMGEVHDHWQQTVDTLQTAGVPHIIAERIAGLEYEYALLDIIEISLQANHSLENIATAYFMTGMHFELNWLRLQIRRQTPETHWDILARVALLDDLDIQQYQLALSFLYFTTQASHTEVLHLSPDHWAPWQAHYADFNQRWQRLLIDLRSTAELKLMVLGIAIRTLASLTRRMDF